MEWDEKSEFPLAVVKQLGKMGLMGVAFPSEYGGAGLGYVDYVIAVEELSRVDGSVGIIVAAHNSLCSNHIFIAGNEEQKRKYIPKLATGEFIGAWGLTEPGSGSDAGSARMTAVRKGRNWVLNGTKTFITNGINADLVIVVACTDPDKGAMGFSLLVVERGMEGFERGRKLDKIGLDAQDTAELSFTDVKVPAENLLGEEGQGFIYLMQNLPQERIGIAVMAATAMETVLELTLQYTKERKAFGRPVGSQQNSRFLLAELATEATVVRMMVDEFIKLHLEEKLTAEQAAMAKWYSTEKQVHLIDRCLQLHGGYGYMREYPVARAYLDARVQTIYGGTTEIMKEIIGRSLGV
jgi:alkylation response protein AidB-like acyl-CoA dehydrogenase